jgi:NAD+ synthase
MGVPAVIRERPPTTDTYALEQSQEEFYFSVPFDKLDLCLYALNQGLPAAAAAAATGLETDVVERVYEDIERKRRAAECLHAPPLLVADLGA